MRIQWFQVIDFSWMAQGIEQIYKYNNLCFVNNIRTLKRLPHAARFASLSVSKRVLSWTNLFLLNHLKQYTQ